MDPCLIAEIVKGKFPEDVLETGSHAGQHWVVLKPEKLRDVCRYLKEDQDLKMDYLIDITAVDYMPRSPRFEVVYQLHSIKHNHRIRLKVPVDESDATVPSVSGIWRTANWHERETYDLLGITFDGHPDPRRILMPDDWEGHPLRKDYPIEGPDWKFRPWPE
jgi:NADH-quinone oxidoreductase subunit C